jgi:putative oxidoreductase
MIDQRSAPYAALILRVMFGVLFLIHDGLKYFVFTPAGTAHYFQSVGLPGPLAYLVMLVELVGGIALILGLWARWAALVLAVDMIGAIVFVHIHNGFFFNNPNGGWEYPGVWTVGLIVVYLLGDGAYALKPTTAAAPVPTRR